jgi:hypothetical protein
LLSIRYDAVDIAGIDNIPIRILDRLFEFGFEPCAQSYGRAGQGLRVALLEGYTLSGSSVAIAISGGQHRLTLFLRRILGFELVG